jgi:O-antigen/teichoic acid export membrane protein
MRKSFLFNIFFTLFINLLIKPFWVFGIDRTVQNQLGEAVYGYFFAVFNFTYLFQILLDFGLQNYNNTEIAAKPSSIKTLLPGLLTSKLLLSLAYISVTTLFAIWTGYYKASFFPWVLGTQVLMSLNIYLRTNVSAHRNFVLDALLSIMDKILMIAVCSLMLWGGISGFELNIDHYVQAQTISLLITTVACVISVAGIERNYVWKFDFQLLKKILIDSLPFAATYFLMTIYYRVDTVMIEKLMMGKGAGEAGMYAQSYRIMESVNNLGYLVAGVLLPLFSYRLAAGLSIRQELRHGLGLMAAMSIPIIMAGWWYAPAIIGTLYSGGDVERSAEVFRLLLLNFFPVAMQYVLGTLLTAQRNFKWMLWSMSIAVLLNILLNFLWILQDGALGAARATLLTQIFMLVSYSIGILVSFQLKFPIRLIIKLLFYVLALTGIIYLNERLNIEWWWGVMSCGMLSIPLSLLTGVLSKEAFKLRIHG